jgi:hypothetical protein
MFVLWFYVEMLGGLLYTYLCPPSAGAEGNQWDGGDGLTFLSVTLHWFEPD